jgi:hypothetical protein
MPWLLNFTDSREAASPWQDRLFLKLLLAALSLRFLVAIGLWLTVAFIGSHDPIIVLSERLRAIDAITYHKEALAILDYWRGDKLVLTANGFSVIMAWLYRFATAHPLTMSAFATLCYLGVGIFSYGLSANLGHSRALARAIALIICLWPSSLAWSVLPLKEPLVLLAVFSFLYLLLKLGLLSWKRIALWLSIILSLTASIAVLVFLRPYLWYFLAATALMPLLGRLLSFKDSPKPPWLGLVAATLIGFMILGAVTPIKSVTRIRYAPQGSIPPFVGPRPAPTPPPRVDRRPRPDFSKETWAENMFRTLNEIREQFATQGGSSLSPEARQGNKVILLTGKFNSWQETVATLAALLKAASRDLLLFPYPWQRWPSGPLRPANLIVGMQSLIWYLLLPGFAVGLLIGLRRRPIPTLTILAWGIGLGLVLGVAVLNRGTLFRLREMALMPLILLWHPWLYIKLWRLLRREGRPTPN